MCPNLTFAQALRLGKERHKAGRLAEAEMIYARLLEAEPAHPEVLHLAGLLARQAGDTGRALDLLSKAVATSPASAACRYNLAVILQEAGESERAIAEFREVARLAPGDAGSRNNLAVLLRRQGRLMEAEVASREAIRLQPRLAAAHFNLAAVLFDLSQTERLAEAEAAARRSVALQPDLAEGHALLAQVLAARRGRSGEGIVAAQAALALDPKRLDHRVLLARLLLRAGRWDEARRAAAPARDDPAHGPEASYILGAVALTRRRPQAAVKAFERALALDPGNRAECHARCIAGLHLALSELGRAGEAEALMGVERFTRISMFVEAPGYADMTAFNEALAGEVAAHPTLRWEPAGYVAHRGSLTDNLVLHPTPAVTVFETLLRGAIDRYLAALPRDSGHPFLRVVPSRYRLDMWATYLQRQGHIGAHIHDGGYLSGAYYVRVPPIAVNASGERGGCIEFGRPSEEFPYNFTPSLKVIDPCPGMLVLFPSALFHRTVPYDVEGTRISLSFNLYSM